MASLHKELLLYLKVLYRVNSLLALSHGKIKLTNPYSSKKEIAMCCIYVVYIVKQKGKLPVSHVNNHSLLRVLFHAHVQGRKHTAVVSPFP